LNEWKQARNWIYSNLVWWYVSLYICMQTTGAESV
jgi:hypothetical protein